MVNTVVYNYYYNHEWFLELMVNTTQIATFTVFFIFKFNSLPNAKILNLTKLKAFADDILNVTKMMISLYDRVENTVGKGENAV